MSGYNNNPRHNNYHFQSWFDFDPELHFLLFMAPVTGFVIRLGRNSCTGDLYVFGLHLCHNHFISIALAMLL